MARPGRRAAPPAASTTANATAAPRPPRRWRRRLAWSLGVLAALALLASLLVGRLLQPERLGPLLLARGGDALGLVLEAEAFDYRLRPAPAVVLEGLRASDPASGATVLRAERLAASLPWSTLRADAGATPTITALALEGWTLDLAALQAWQAARPAGPPAALPTLAEGLAAEDGALAGEGWTLRIASLALPRLAEGAPATLEADGALEVGAAAWPWRLRASATPSGADGLALDALDLALGGADAPEALRLTGALALARPTWLTLEGRLDAWPLGWPALPALPAPLRPPGAASPLALVLALREEAGATALALALSQDAPADAAAPLAPGALAPDAAAPATPTTLAIDGPLEAFAGWDPSAPGDPLPGVSLRLQAPRLEIDGALLEGLEIELAPADADAEAEAAADADAPPR